LEYNIFLLPSVQLQGCLPTTPYEWEEKYIFIRHEDAASESACLSNFSRKTPILITMEGFFYSKTHLIG
jgi:hypothetical protein